MNRSAFFVTLAAFVASGALAAVMGYRAISAAGTLRGGSSREPDADYQKIPADASADWMTGFTLTERSGRQVQWQGLDGKVRVVSFFFSSCPANCLQQNQKVGEIQRAYAAKDVVFLSITCDPDIDSPKRLTEYANQLSAPPKQWLFLTGKLIYIRRVAAELFQVALDKKTHTERLIVCDKWGNVRGTFLWNKLDEVTQLRLLVDTLLTEDQPPESTREDE